MKSTDFTLDAVGEGEDGACRESSSETCTFPSLKQIAGGNSLLAAGSSHRCSDNLEGWHGVGGGREAREGGDMCIPMTGPCGSMQNPT